MYCLPYFICLQNVGSLTQISYNTEVPSNTVSLSISTKMYIGNLYLSLKNVHDIFSVYQAEAEEDVEEQQQEQR